LYSKPKLLHSELKSFLSNDSKSAWSKQTTFIIDLGF